MRPSLARAVTTPNIGGASDAALRALLVSANAEYRVQAQREILRRGARPGVQAALAALATNRQQPDYARVAALFTLSQLVGAKAQSTIMALTSTADPLVRAMALRALADDPKATSESNGQLIVRALVDPDARVQAAALHAAARLKAVSLASSIVPLTASPDVVVSHLAVNALVALGAESAALAALDAPASSRADAMRAGVLRALQQMHTPTVVDGLIQRTAVGAGNRDIVLALARLHHREEAWTGSWWGTRPSFIGPYFAPVTWDGSARITPVLRDALTRASGSELPALVDAFIRNRVLPLGARALLLAVADDASLRGVAIEVLTGNQKVTPAMLPLLQRANTTLPDAVAQLVAAEPGVAEGLLPLVRGAALNAAVSDSVRARLIGLLGTVPGRPGLDAATSALVASTPAVTPAGTAAGPVEAAWRRFVGDRRRTQELDYFIDLSRASQPNARVLGFSVLLQSVRGGRAPAAVNDKVQPVLTAAWQSRAAAPDLVRAVGIMRLESAYAEQLATLRTPPARAAAQMEWTPLFNGKDLKDWDIKFAGHKLGVNFRNTFRVDSGMLRVRYDDWPDFNGQFGHIFYRKPFSHYLIAVEYRFTGEQVTGAGSGNSWAIRNNGIMAHSQSAASMGLTQDFPISLEIQMLGGLGRGTRTTANLCTPGTHVVMAGKLVTAHCTNSNSVTLDGDQWVRVEALVLGDSIIKHIVNGDTVMTYSKPQMGGGAANNTMPGVLVDGKALTEGFIALQAETAPIDFRKVEIVNLKGCMKPGDRNYRAYFVQSDPSACRSR